MADNGAKVKLTQAQRITALEAEVAALKGVVEKLQRMMVAQMLENPAIKKRLEDELMTRMRG